MPGYGLPKGNKGLLPWTWAEQRLKKSHNYWITTVKPDGSPQPSPHTMVVWGLWQDGRFLFSTGSKSRKARNLAQNAHCIVCTELANEAVIVEGVAVIADVAARRKFLPDSNSSSKLFPVKAGSNSEPASSNNLPHRRGRTANRAAFALECPLPVSP